MGFRDFVDDLAFCLLIVGIVAAIFAVPIAIIYFVFLAVSSPGINDLVKGAVFALYTIGVFLTGVFMTGSAYEYNRKKIIELIDQCEDKVASISLDVRRCNSDVLNSVESKMYDVMTCLKAIEEKI
jgi:hypothetical protein